jgi:E3 ubiquitin-protein ligase HUWE1
MLIIANVCDSNSVEKQLYNTRPDILQQLVRLLHSDSEAGISLKTVVLKTLRTLARNSLYASNRRSEHSRFHQILNALDASLNHGILMTLLRETVAFLQSHDPNVEEMQYAQALQRLVREFLESPQGASNLGFAGIVPLLVDIMKIERSSIWSVVVTVADLLGALLPHQRHNQLLPLFMDIDGLGTVVRVIKVHLFGDEN